MRELVGLRLAYTPQEYRRARARARRNGHVDLDVLVMGYGGIERPIWWFFTDEQVKLRQ